ncbi:hypothetical protein [Nonomuraea endophytica]|uniref:hypothetical protein n=1 Tax=Nonomuraea endophytica TaxID=714136 RepID=UPI0037C681D2
MKRLIALVSGLALAGTLVTPPAQAAAAAPVRLKLSFGWCESACAIRIKVTNNSRRNIAWVGGTCRLHVNGRYVGKGTIYVGPIRRGHSRTSTCNVVDDRLEDAWYDFQDNGGLWQRYASVKAKPYYRR